MKFQRITAPSVIESFVAAWRRRGASWTRENVPTGGTYVILAALVSRDLTDEELTQLETLVTALPLIQVTETAVLIEAAPDLGEDYSSDLIVTARIRPRTNPDPLIEPPA